MEREHIDINIFNKECQMPATARATQAATTVGGMGKRSEKAMYILYVCVCVYIVVTHPGAGDRARTHSIKDDVLPSS